MNARDLIATARTLVERGSSQANLRRAVSTAYYAVFHCLAAMAADLLMGRPRDEAWHQVYRALEHGRARNACENKRAMAAFPPEVRAFADAFVDLQKARHQADYTPHGRYNQLDALAAIDRAEEAIEAIGRVDARCRRSFAAHVLFRQRPSPGGSK